MRAAEYAPLVCLTARLPAACISITADCQCLCSCSSVLGHSSRWGSLVQQCTARTRSPGLSTCSANRYARPSAERRCAGAWCLWSNRKQVWDGTSVLPGTVFSDLLSSCQVISSRALCQQTGPCRLGALQAFVPHVSAVGPQNVRSDMLLSFSV